MSHFLIKLLPILLLGIGLCSGPAIAADSKGAAPAGFAQLLGTWVRPDGGYTITINSVDPDGKLDASYANPGKLPFSQASASLNKALIKVFLELRAGGYNGSTYRLTYEPGADVLRGVYYQANAQQKFDVYFERAR